MRFWQFTTDQNAYITLYCWRLELWHLSLMFLNTYLYVCLYLDLLYLWSRIPCDVRIRQRLADFKKSSNCWLRGYAVRCHRRHHNHHHHHHHQVFLFLRVRFIITCVLPYNTIMSIIITNDDYQRSLYLWFMFNHHNHHDGALAGVREFGWISGKVVEDGKDAGAAARFVLLTSQGSQIGRPASPIFVSWLLLGFSI